MATINPTQSPFDPTSTAYPPSIAPARPVLRAEDDEADETGARPAASVGPGVVSIVLLFGLAVAVAFAGRGIVEMLTGLAAA